MTPALKEGTGSSTAEGRAGGRWFSLGNGLVVAQVALAVVVLVGAGLLVRTLENLKNVDPGFDTRNLLTFGVDPTLIGYKTPQVDAFYRNLQARLAAIPGVESVSYSNTTLLSGSLWETGFHLAGTPKGQEAVADYLPVGANFFSTMHMRLLAGRNFNSADFAQAEVAQQNEEAQEAAQEARDAAVAANPAAPASSFGKATKPAENQAAVPVMVNRTFLRKYFPRVSPLGQRFGEAEECRHRRAEESRMGDCRCAQRREISGLEKRSQSDDVCAVERGRHGFRIANDRESLSDHLHGTQRVEPNGS